QLFTVNARGNFDAAPTFEQGPFTGFRVVGGLSSLSGGGNVPEPSGFLVMLTGVILFGFRRSR
ncbi:MAG: PEP-CTERM sorting domain-containing protein, partial [Rubripirellula sp.]|nr:PEP-CTERM sorting domain-containing protein [Rubripirellula sp.]